MSSQPSIRELFAGRVIVARGLSADAHLGHTVDDLINIILTTGTDRYDPDRPGDRYTNIGGKRIDLFGFRRAVSPRMKLFANLSWGFYHGFTEVRRRPTRLDIVFIYDATNFGPHCTNTRDDPIANGTASGSPIPGTQPMPSWESSSWTAEDR